MEYRLENKWLSVKFQSLGGALSSIRDKDGVEYLWQGDKKYWGGQAPVLFPICGSLRNDQGRLKNGKKITMPRHGIVRKKEFICEEQTKDSITFCIESDEEIIILDELKSKKIAVVSKNHGKEIRLDFSDFPYLILWSSSNNGPFIALEPWSGLSTCNDEGDLFEEKRNVQYVNAYSDKKSEFQITIIENE